MIASLSRLSKLTGSSNQYRFYRFCWSKGPQIEEDYVHKTYDKIAEHFSQTRYKPWPRVARFIQHIKRGSLVLDVGSGNGRNISVNKAIQTIGVDRCIPLLNISRQKHPNNDVIAADIFSLPIRSECCDSLICIALLHHIATRERRVQALAELGRILRPGGTGLVYVRATQTIRKTNQIIKTLPQDFLDPWHLQTKYERDLEQAIQQGHEHVKEKNSVVYQRYYHAYQQGELDEQIRATQKFAIEDSFYDYQNWACIVRRL